MKNKKEVNVSIFSIYYLQRRPSRTTAAAGGWSPAGQGMDGRFPETNGLISGPLKDQSERGSISK